MNALIHKRNPWPLALCTALLVGCGSDLPQKTTDTNAPTNPNGGDNTTPTQKYTVTTQLRGAAGGSISPATQQVEANQVLVLTLSPLEGKAVDSVSGCGGTLGSDNRTFVTAPLASACTVNYSFRDVATVTSWEPTNVRRNVSTTLTFKGLNFPTSMVLVDNAPGEGNCQAVQRISATEAKAQCTFSTLGQHGFALQDLGTGTPLAFFAAKVNVTSNVDKVTWMGTGDSTNLSTNATTANPEVPYNTPTEFTVKGVNLDPALIFSIDQCQTVQALGGTATEQKFRCTFKATATDPWVNPGYKLGQVKTGDGKQTLLNFAVRNSVDSSLRDLSTLSTTGVNWCATTTELPLICSKESLAALYGAGQDGEVQAGQTPVFAKITQGNDHCLKDSHSGLTWELKSTASSRTDSTYWRSVVHSYTWYAPGAPGGQPGIPDDSVAYPNVPAGQSCASTLQTNGVGSCNTKAYIDRLNREAYCGITTWRLPTRMELLELVNYGQFGGTAAYYGQSSTADENLFVDQMNGWVWSQSTNASPQLAWTVHFGFGSVGVLPKNTKAQIRAVSGP